MDIDHVNRVITRGHTHTVRLHLDAEGNETFVPRQLSMQWVTDATGKWVLTAANVTGTNGAGDPKMIELVFRPGVLSEFAPEWVRQAATMHAPVDHEVHD